MKNVDPLQCGQRTRSGSSMIVVFNRFERGMWSCVMARLAANGSDEPLKIPRQFVPWRFVARQGAEQVRV
jgi:hypothetical protein